MFPRYFSGLLRSQQELDTRVERWLRARWQCDTDFEVPDAVRKLTRLELVRQVEQRLCALLLGEARRQLDRRWDSLFQYAPNDP